MTITDAPLKAPTDGSATAWCCFIPHDQEVAFLDAKPGAARVSLGCQIPAEYLIVHGPGVDDYTHACASHVGHLIPDDTEARVVPIGWSM